MFAGAANLTLGANATVNHTGTVATNGSITADPFEGGGTITNKGSIIATNVSGGYAGRRRAGLPGRRPRSSTRAVSTVSNGDNVVIQSTSFSNTGTVTVTTGGILDIGPRFPSAASPPTTFTSTGVLSENGGTINLNGAVTLANFGQITRAPNNTSGVIALNGTADLGGGTLRSAAPRRSARWW